MEDADDSDECPPLLAMSKERPSVQEASPVPSRSSSRSSAVSRRAGFMELQQCPTCRGEGHLPRGQSEELVALIPYSDKRLRPRRRWFVYVSVALVVVLVCGGVLLAFMFPRSASISLVAMNTSGQWLPIDNSSDVTILMETYVRIKNDNFFHLKVQWLSVSLFNLNIIVSTEQTTSVSVGPRQDSVAVVIQNATFPDELGLRVRTICTGSGWEHCLAMFAQVEMQYSVLSHSAGALASKTFFVTCDIIGNSNISSCS